MGRNQKIGAAMVLVGVFIPLFSLCFSAVYEYRDPARPYWQPPRVRCVVITAGHWVSVGEREVRERVAPFGRRPDDPLSLGDLWEVPGQRRYDSWTNEYTEFVGRVVIEYKWFVAAGIVLVFAGIAVLLFRATSMSRPRP
jgi:hypothetical protein